jgi:hypothetical protein
MPRSGFVLLPLILSTIYATAATAQTCGGTASFASGPVRIGAGIDDGNGARVYGAQIAAGKPAGPFVGGGIGRIELDDFDASGTSFAGQVGYGLGLGTATSSPFELCPIIGLGYVTAEVSESGVSVDISSRQLSAGLSIGGVMSSTPTFAFVPSLAFMYVNEKLETDGFIEIEETEDYGVVTLAAGLVFNQRVTLRPNMAFPVGLDDSDPTFGVAIAFNFGNPSSSGRRAR